MKEIYPLLSSAMNQELRMGQIANNLANINTPGFKRDDAVFKNMLNAAMDSTNTPLGGPGTANPSATGWTSILSSYTDYGQGELQTTGGALDVALDSAGFFMIRGESGEVFYTRAGNFKVNERNELITAQGRPVLNANQQPITIDLRQGKPLIMPDGTILQGGATVGRLGVMQFDEPGKLIKHGEGALFAAPGGVIPRPMAQPAVRQEMLESSNVSAIDEMVRMIQTERSYQIQQKMIQTMDDMTARRLDTARG